MASPRPKTRGKRQSLPKPPLILSNPSARAQLDTKDTLCRNVLIYGHCRYEDQGCAFNHDKGSSNSPDA